MLNLPSRIHVSLFRAASMAAMSIFFIVIIASKARFASPPPAASASVSGRVVICQKRPQRSLHQPHWLSEPQLPTNGVELAGGSPLGPNDREPTVILQHKSQFGPRIVAKRVGSEQVLRGISFDVGTWLDLSVESDNGTIFSFTVPVSPQLELSLTLPPKKPIR